MRAAIALVALVLCGCPYAPIDFGPRGRVTDPAVAIESVRARRAKTTKAQGEAKANVTTPDGSGRITQYVVAEQPDKLHIESISFFNNPVAVVASDGEHFQLLDLENKRFYEGLATPGNLARFVRIAIAPADLVSLLVGVPPLLERPDSVTLDVDDKERAYVLTLVRGSTTHALLLDPSTLRPRAITVRDGEGLTSFRAAFDEYEGARDLPKVVRLASGDVTVELTWKEREEDPEIDPSAFSLAVPEGVERVRVP